MSRPTPYRFAPAAFYRYAPIIGAALRAWPNRIQVNPAPLKAESFVQPCRDAITAKRRYGYQHPTIDDTLFERHCADLTVSITEAGTVLIGSRSQKDKKTVDFTATTQEFAIELHAPNLIVLDRLAALVTAKVFHPCPTFYIRSLNPDDQKSIESQYDLVFAEVEGEPNKHQIIT